MMHLPTGLTQNRPSRQNGLSMIELMVAVVIGLFIILGLSQIFLSMYSTSQSQSTLFQYQNNQRTAITSLINQVQLASYFAQTPTSVSFGSTVLPAVTNADGSTFIAGTGIVEPYGASAKTTDTLNIYYQTNGIDNIYNCQGGVAAITSPVTYVTYINSFSVNSSNQLVCTVTTNGVGKPSTAQVLADNISSMTILFGVDTTGSGGVTNTTNAYLTAAKMTAAMWPNVRAVQITLNFCTPNPLVPALTNCSTTTPWVQTINVMGKS